MKTFQRLIYIGLVAMVVVMIWSVKIITQPSSCHPSLNPYKKMQCSQDSKPATYDGTPPSASDVKLLSKLFPAHTAAFSNSAYEVWKYPQLWADRRNVYTAAAVESGQLTAVLTAMSTAKIIQISDISSGRQNKLMLVLDGGQIAIFKPKRYASECLTAFDSTSRGHDRHFAEIVAFHLDKVLQLYRTPLTVGRKLDFSSAELQSVINDDIRNDIRYIDHANEWCYYRSCCGQSNCKVVMPSCTEDGLMEGALVLVLPFQLGELTRNPMVDIRRPFIRMRLLMPLFGADMTYLLDLIDTSIFDYLIGNIDRHHFETFDEPGAAIILLDNGKGLASTATDDGYLLEMVRNLCVIRANLWKSLSRADILDELKLSLKFDPLHPVLAEEFYGALRRRRQTVVNTVVRCARQHGWSNVLKYDL